MGRSLIRIAVLAAVLTYAVASSLAETRKILCSPSPAPFQSAPPQSHPQWLNIDWPLLIKGAHSQAFIGLESELVVILATLTVAFFFLTWLQRRLKAAAHLPRQPLPRTSVLLLFVLLATAFKCTPASLSFPFSPNLGVIS
jgi:hypothetical protein